MICALELVAIKLNAREMTNTDEKFFGMSANFKKNWLRSVRKKRLS